MSGFLKKIKNRKIMVISAGRPESGASCLFCIAGNDTWEVANHACIPYPQRVESLLNRFFLTESQSSPVSPREMAELDYRLSLFFTECARTTLAPLRGSQRTPHFAVVSRPYIWKGPIEEGQPDSIWDFSIGDVRHLAVSMRIPVVTDLVRHQCIAQASPVIPTGYGDIKIAAPCGGTVIFIDIGLISHMTIVDTGILSVIVDSDTGPGACCINDIVNREHVQSNCDGFDRDGSIAATGTVNGECLHNMAQTSWFLEPGPKHAEPHMFNELTERLQFTALSPADQLATITALTARSIYDFYRSATKPCTSPQTVYLSGGASHNQTLIEYIKTYFDTIPVKSIEELSVPSDMRTLLALALTVNGYAGGASMPLAQGDNPRLETLGTWVWP